jgi:biotin transporter BioY
MNRTNLIRNIAFVLLGAFGLILTSKYVGPYYELVHSYAGNVTASFAVYFVVSIGSKEFRFNRLIVAVLALLVVELFEATNGFGVMTNTYDPFDFLANVVGVALAIGADVVSARIMESRSNSSSSIDQESPSHTTSE